MMTTCRILLPRSNSNNAIIGNPMKSVGLTSAAIPQSIPHSAHLLDFPECNLRVSNKAALSNSADNEVSQGMNGRIATYGHNAHIHAANTPALSL